MASRSFLANNDISNRSNSVFKIPCIVLAMSNLEVNNWVNSAID